MVRQLTSSQDICDAIMNPQKIANMNNLRLNEIRKINSLSKIRRLILTKAFVLPIQLNTVNNNSKLTVTGLKKYYNFFNSNSFLYTHFMSDQLNFERLYPVLSRSSTNINISVKKDKISTIITDNNYLNIKMANWKMMQRTRGSQLNLSELASDCSNDPNKNGAINYCKKPLCSECKKVCQYRLSEINEMLNNKSLLTQAQIINELSLHGHPKSRLNALKKIELFLKLRMNCDFII